MMDPAEKTVIIPAKVVGGKIVRENGKPLPEIKYDANIEIKVPTYEYVKILDRGSTLIVAIKPGKLNQKHSDYLGWVIKEYNLENVVKASLIKTGYAELILLDDLYLIIRGSKPPILQHCKVEIPFLEKEARSVNHAYTLISTEFETERISHTGNVFKHVFFQAENKRWFPLEEIKLKVVEEFNRLMNGH